MDITSRDWELVKSQCIDMRIRLEIFNNTVQKGKLIEDTDLFAILDGSITGGSSSISADSDVRRTFSVTLSPSKESQDIISEQGLIWLNKTTHLKIGIFDKLLNDFRWYNQGIYVFTNTSTSYDASTNQLTINCGDLMSNLDGTKNGTLGQLTISIPAYLEVMSSLWLADWRDDMDLDTLKKMAKASDEYRKQDFFEWMSRNHEDAYYYIFGTGGTNIPTLGISKTSVDADTLWKCFTTNKEWKIENDNVTNKSWEEFARRRSSKQGGDIDSFIVKMKSADKDIDYCENSDAEVNHIIKHYICRDAVIMTVKQLGRFVKTDYVVDDFGEPSAMPEANVNWKDYRDTYGDWNYIPHDLEFSSGCSILSIITELRDLYPNYEAYFDENGVFHFNMIPSLYEDDPVASNADLSELLISESTSIDLTAVSNVVEVWGKSIEVDFYTENPKSISYDSAKRTINLSIDGYNSAFNEENDYVNGDQVGFKSPITSDGKRTYIRINGLGRVELYKNYNLLNPVDAGAMKEGETYVIKIVKKYYSETKDTCIGAYLMGQYQVHALCALVENASGDPSDMYNTTSGDIFPRFSKEYFQSVYACDNVKLMVIPDSPFTCQKIGEVLDVCNGAEFEVIDNQSTAIDTAWYQLWTRARLTDSINITTKLCPFADVNTKVTYHPVNDYYDSKYVNQYIVKGISHDWTNGTTTWDMMRFYPLYENNDENYREVIDAHGVTTWGDLLEYPNDYLSRLTPFKISDKYELVSFGTIGLRRGN